MSDFGTEFSARLKEERTRLGLSQAALGALGGVGKLAQMNYEKGTRVPSVEYLHAIGQNGVDAVYLMTGKRGGEQTINHSLLAECTRLIDEIFTGPTMDRAACIAFLYAYAKRDSSRRIDLSLAARAIVDGWTVGKRGNDDK